MVHYEMYKRDAANKCADCGKKTREVSDKEWVIDYRNSPNYKLGDTAREYLCLNCGDRINQININEANERIRRDREQKQSVLSEKADKLPSELRQLWVDLEPKVENEDLEVKDVKRIYALKKKVNEFLKEAKKVDINSDYWTKINIASVLLQNSPTDLNNFVKEHASPLTIDITKKGKYSRIRDCSHLKGIEPCTDDPTFFCCSYCWDTDSPKFLNRLKRWHITNIQKTLKDNNINLIDFFKNSAHDYYDKLSDNTFFSQEEIKTVYLEAEKDLKIFLKSKGINIDKQHRERERERERAKLQSAIANLENKPTKTPEEVAELESLKNKLKDLDKKANNSSPNSYLPWIIGGGCLVVALVIIVFIATRKKRTN